MSGRKARGKQRGASAPKSKGPPPVPFTLARSIAGGHAGWVSLPLVAVTLVAYAGVWQNGFVSWDDPYYVSENPHVLSGLTWKEWFGHWHRSEHDESSVV